MGAELWHHEAPWHPDPEEALRALQAQFLADNYDLAALVPVHLESARAARAAAQSYDDPFHLADLYAEQVQLLEQLGSQPLPADPQPRIQILRQIYAGSGQGISNVLDVMGVSDDYFAAQVLSDERVAHFAGVTRPTIVEAHEAIDQINEELNRGECVCFPIYDEARKSPVGWYFVGNTVD